MIDHPKKPTTTRIPMAGGDIVVTSGGCPPSEEASRLAFIRGARRLKGDATKIQELEALHNEIRILEDQIAVPSGRHITAAAESAGKALFKTLGRDCFASQSEAVSWAARNLPLSKAKAAAVADADHKQAASAQRSAVRKAFGELSIEVSRPIADKTRHSHDTVLMVAEVQTIGLFE